MVQHWHQIIFRQLSLWQTSIFTAQKRWQMLFQFYSVALHQHWIPSGSIAKVQINLHELVQGWVQIIFRQLALWQHLHSAFSLPKIRKGCSNTMFLCIICHIPTGSIAKVRNRDVWTGAGLHSSHLHATYPLAPPLFRTFTTQNR